MVNLTKIDGMLEQLRTFIGFLREFAAVPRKDFLRNRALIGGARYYLQVAIQCCIDLANHIIASEGFRAPQDYGDAFTVLNENRIVPDHFLRTLHEMTGLRHRLVHDYPHIEDAQIHKILSTELKDFDTFARCLLDFVDRGNADDSG